jgi:hypothetical protein
MPEDHSRASGASHFYEAALREAIAERDRIDNEEVPKLRERISAAQVKREQLSKAIESVLTLLPPDRRVLYEDSAEQEQNSRGGILHNRIINLFSKAPARDWTAQSIQEALKITGVEVDIKPIHNVLNYLERDGKLKRTSRGKYLYVAYDAQFSNSSFENPSDAMRHPHFRNDD